MFGKKRRLDRHDDQQMAGVGVPTSVYAAARSPYGSRRRLLRIVLLVLIAIGLAVLAVYGGIRVYRHFSDTYSGSGASSQSGKTTGNSDMGGITTNDDKNGKTDTTNPSAKDTTPAPTKQDPQNTSTLPKATGQPATTPLSGSGNSSPVDRPE